MTISAGERDELREAAREALGERGADLLMAGLTDIDIRSMEERLSLRIDLVRAELRGEMSDLRTELCGEMSDLRGEFSELRGEFRQLRGDVRGQIGELRGEIATQVKVFHFAIVTTLVGIAGLIYTAYQAGQ